MTPEILIEGAKALGPIILGGSFFLGVAAIIKSRAEALKLRKEAKKTEVETLGLPDEATLTAQAMREAITTIRDIAADANASRERAEQSEERMRAALEASRTERSELWARIQNLERNQAEMDRQAEASRHEITRLQTKLAAARDLVSALVAFIKKHVSPEINHPVVDYSIFDR